MSTGKTIALIKGLGGGTGSSGGADGITPHIGANGNWYIGETDTGVKAKGENGYTPVRGTDYWTAADIAEIKGYVDTAILNGSW